MFISNQGSRYGGKIGNNLLHADFISIKQNHKQIYWLYEQKKIRSRDLLKIIVMLIGGAERIFSAWEDLPLRGKVLFISL